MFNQWNRNGHRQLSAEIQAELADLAKRHGLKVSVGGGQIGATNLVIKVTVETGDTSIADAQARRQIDIDGRYFGLTGSDYGTVFVSNGKRFKFTGVQPSRPKFPLSGECMSTGRSFKFTRSIVNAIVAARPSATSSTPAAGAMPPVRPAAQQGSYDPRFAGQF